MIDNLLRRVFRHQDITHKGSLYLRRFLLTPKVFGWRLMLHRICRPDVDRALHCHPWDFAVLCLRGGYQEMVLASDGALNVETLTAGRVRLRSSNHTHRIARVLGPAAWTLVLHGPRRRQWGFWDTDQTPPTFTLAADYFTPGYDAATPPRRGTRAEA